MTEFSEVTLRDWLTNPCLARLAKSGTLRFGVFDVTAGMPGRSDPDSSTGACDSEHIAPDVRILLHGGGELTSADFTSISAAGLNTERGSARGGVLPASTARRPNPLIVVCGYLFDSLPMDVLQV